MAVTVCRTAGRLSLRFLQAGILVAALLNFAESADADEQCAAGEECSGDSATPKLPVVPQKKRLEDDDELTCENRMTEHRYPRFKANKRVFGAPVWSVDDLRLHNGTAPKSPLLLAVLGEVYDVGSGAKFYAPCGDYEAFSGTDGSRALPAFDTGNVSGLDLRSEILDLDLPTIQRILDWRAFFRDDAKYRFVGFLNERYFDEEGRPTPEGERLIAVSRAQDSARRLVAGFEKRFMPCNYIHHNEETPDIELSCDREFDGKTHAKGLQMPFHFYYTIHGGEGPGEVAQDGNWCACMLPEDRREAEAEAAELAKQTPKPGEATFRIVFYPECQEGEVKCFRRRGDGPPSELTPEEDVAKGL